jgi:hypothetical protein
MSLSQNVENSIKEAEGNLRNALYWASKNEKSNTIMQISKILFELDQIKKIENMMDKLENRSSGDGGMFGQFFTDM